MPLQATTTRRNATPANGQPSHLSPALVLRQTQVAIYGLYGLAADLTQRIGSRYPFPE